jgi:predicted NAD-dependent protein-ADP-ribosyltransferase YbiA (DUF1768 family)
MVVSRIDSSVVYAENKSINPNDVKRESRLYQIMWNRLNIIIAVGSQKHTNHNITYFPIYLVKSNNSVIQIGIFEILTNKIDKYLDSKRALKIEKLGEPLIYTCITKKMVQQMRKQPETNIKNDELTDDEDEDPTELAEAAITNRLFIPNNRNDIFVLSKNVPLQKELRSETHKDALDSRQKYHASTTDIWINKFMQNKNYYIDTIEGSDTCFFTAIKDAYASINQHTTVEKLKNKLSLSVTEDMFRYFKNAHELLINSDEKIKTQLKQLQKQNADLKVQLTKTINRNLQHQFIVEGEKNLVLFNRLKNEKKMVDYHLQEYRYLKGIRTLDDFIRKIKTCDFWAETWAISTVELMLNVKFIILSNDEFSNADLNHVLVCGLAPSVKKIVIPEYYIILSKSKNNYHLVSYKNHKIFTQKELPFDIRTIIKDKCVEENGGRFEMIPGFMVNRGEGVEEKGSQSGGGGENSSPHTNPRYMDTFDNNIVFRFYEKSSNRPPGKNSGEKLNIEFIHEYGELTNIPDWRKKLANTWVQPFVLDGHKWNSVEHYYQASKFKKYNHDFYLDFSLDSKNELSKNVSMCQSVGGISGKYNGSVFREKHVVIDPEFYSHLKNKVLHDAQYAKFSQNPELKNLLLATKNAKLLYHKKGRPPEVYYELMIVRKEL